jgi:dTDP-4-amino-4,6-dideoxygalactose transaminase
MSQITKIAKKYKLYVIEDAAESHGSEYKKRRTGSLGHIGCFSFYPNKNMTTGEGGMCTTNDKGLAKKMMMLRNHGRDKSKGNYFHVMLGFNYMMTELQATIGLVQLKRLNWVIKQRIKMAEYYNKQFNKIDGVTTPYVKHYNKHTYMFYPILIKNRDKIAKVLSQRGIETSKAFYPPIHKQPIYQKLGFGNVKLPVTEEISKRVLCIPIWVGLKRTQQDQVIRAIKNEI